MADLILHVYLCTSINQNQKRQECTGKRIQCRGTVIKFVQQKYDLFPKDISGSKMIFE